MAQPDQQQANVSDALMPWEEAGVAGNEDGQGAFLGAWDSAEEEVEDSDDAGNNTDDVEDEPAVPESEDEDSGDESDELDEEESEEDESEDDEEEESESEETDEEDAEDEEELFEVVLPGGEKGQYTLDELKRGFSRTEDYTRKTQEVARLRDETSGLRDQYSEKIDRVGQVLEKLKPEEPDWDKLREENPAEYAAQREDWRTRQAQIDAVEKEQQKLREEAHQEQQRRLQEYAQEETEKLLKVFPEWSEPSKQQEVKGRLSQAAKDRYGFTDEELGSLIDHRLIRVLHDAVEGAQIKEKGEESLQKGRKKNKGKTKTLKPGSAKGRHSKPNTKKNKALNEQMGQLAKSGKPADALSVFEMLLDEE